VNDNLSQHLTPEGSQSSLLHCTRVSYNYDMNYSHAVVGTQYFDVNTFRQFYLCNLMNWFWAAPLLVLLLTYHNLGGLV